MRSPAQTFSNSPVCSRKSGRDGFPTDPCPAEKVSYNSTPPGATLATIDDARLTSLESLFGGFEASGGGLHGGSFSATDAFEGTLTLRNASYLKRLRVSGSLKIIGSGVRGSVTVSGLIRGTLTVNARGGVRGVLGGRRVAIGPQVARAARASSPAVLRSALRITRARVARRGS